METIKYVELSLASAVFCIALYTYLSHNIEFRESSPSLLAIACLQVFSLFLTSVKLVADEYFPAISEWVVFCFLLVFCSTWLILLYVLYRLYGRLYHLREKRFLKYIKPMSIIYDKFFHNEFQERRHDPRTVPIFTMFSNILANESIDKLKDGGTLLILYEDDYDIENLILNILLETTKSNETVDYIAAERHPIFICDAIKKCKGRDGFNYEKFIDRFSIIDAFTPRYTFDDKVIKSKTSECKKEGFVFFQAKTFAGIHTAVASSWYRFNKSRQKKEGIQQRRAHRSVYQALSSMITFHGSKQFILFLRHVISSEKAYGMITIILEPLSIDANILSELKRMSDVILDLSNNAFNRMAKTAPLNDRGERYLETGTRPSQVVDLEV